MIIKRCDAYGQGVRYRSLQLETSTKHTVSKFISIIQLNLCIKSIKYLRYKSKESNKLINFYISSSPV